MHNIGSKQIVESGLDFFNYFNSLRSNTLQFIKIIFFWVITRRLLKTEN